MPAARGSNRDRGPRAEIRRLYGGVDGFEIPRAEERQVRASRGDPLYGELTPASVDKLLAYLEPGPRDVFYDLGSGVGKVVVQAAMTAPMKKCVGIELSRSRCRLARSRLRMARHEGLILARRCSFRNEDFMESNLGDATLVYTCSTAFSLRFMKRLARKLAGLGRRLTFVTLQELEPHRAFEPIDLLRLDVTWRRRAKVHVYRVSPPASSSRQP